nr:unnamed protein product [Digitaria exilis]
MLGSHEPSHVGGWGAGPGPDGPGPAPPNGRGDGLEHRAGRVAWPTATPLGLNAGYEAPWNGDVTGGEVSAWALWRSKRRLGYVPEGLVVPDEENGRRGEPAGELPNGSEELSHPEAISDGVVPCHAHKIPSAAELGDLHHERRVVQPAAIAVPWR